MTKLITANSKVTTYSRIENASQFTTNIEFYNPAVAQKLTHIKIPTRSPWEFSAYCSIGSECTININIDVDDIKRKSRIAALNRLLK